MNAHFAKKKPRVGTGCRLRAEILVTGEVNVTGDTVACRETIIKPAALGLPGGQFAWIPALKAWQHKAFTEQLYSNLRAAADRDGVSLERVDQRRALPRVSAAALIRQHDSLLGMEEVEEDEQPRKQQRVCPTTAPRMPNRLRRTVLDDDDDVSAGSSAPRPPSTTVSVPGTPPPPGVPSDETHFARARSAINQVHPSAVEAPRTARWAAEASSAMLTPPHARPSTSSIAAGSGTVGGLTAQQAQRIQANREAAAQRLAAKRRRELEGGLEDARGGSVSAAMPPTAPPAAPPVGQRPDGWFCCDLSDEVLASIELPVAVPPAAQRSWGDSFSCDLSDEALASIEMPGDPASATAAAPATAVAGVQPSPGAQPSSGSSCVGLSAECAPPPPARRGGPYGCGDAHERGSQDTETEGSQTLW